jgi:hypothetical protein
LDVQKAAEEGLGERAGAVVALDPNSGEILALASHPNFDPNLFPRGIPPKDWVRLMNDDWHPLYNRAIQSVYPPGSTFKIIVSLAGLETGVIKPHDTVVCRGGLKLGNHTFRCWKKEGHGVVSFHDGLVSSCDVYFYTMGDRIGWDKVAEYARKLGFGSVTGIEIPDEKAGLIPTMEWKKKRTNDVWRTADTYINSIGQGFVLVSPIHVLQTEPHQADQKPRDRRDNSLLLRALAQDILRSGGTAGGPERPARRHLRASGNGPRRGNAAGIRRGQNRHRPGDRPEGRRPQTDGEDGRPCVVRGVCTRGKSQDRSCRGG